ncbi:uracil-DNA glycosylase [Mesosutterella sp. AGMB02718]|uniref:Uracil-DNA glycosylase n=1 Tax=Mesosutterella faecium TaxID=2925194 RepID=A0ABT7IL89_9BURK|nr:uracil-DNA glycosylase [Mesosutterella sp. AGMB02718]MDL2058683.1 uracil-DNA glycosylase [Mesosutterella sp. AGMB02718]
MLWPEGCSANGWEPLLKNFFLSEPGLRLERFLKERSEQGAVIYPPTPFRAFELTPRDAVKVVIMGQDPYHERGQAQGLAFSVSAKCPVPPSLKNIFKELRREYSDQCPVSGDLSFWALQGVFLQNAVLTVEEGRAGSHAGRGWEILTDQVIDALARDSAPKVFLLWGAAAQKKEKLIVASGHDHLILKCNHPSPLSANRPPVPFIGCGHFRKANEWLTRHGRLPVNWVDAS